MSSPTPVIFDDGSKAMVPQERLSDALRDGGKVAQAMQFDDGSKAYVPLDRIHDAIHDGGMLIGSAPQPPQPVMQKSNLATALSPNGEHIANPQQPAESFALENPEQQAPLAAASAVGAAGAAAPALVGPVARLAAKHPVIGGILMSEGISQARKIPILGKYIPPYSEMLPMLLSKGGGAAAEGEVAAEAEAAAAAKSVPTKAPIEAPVEAPQPKIKPAEVQAQIERGLGNEPLNLKKDVPLREQMPNAPRPADLPEGHTAVESSAVKSYQYDAAKQELHVRPVGGRTTYIYGDVSADQAAEFSAHDSKGTAWQDIKRGSSPIVAKIIDGKRIAVRPVPKAPDEDLTQILQQSLDKVRAASAAND